MDKEELKEKVKVGTDKAVDTAKSAFGKAVNVVQDFSDKSVIKIEKMQCESKRKNQYTQLGELVASRLLNEQSITISMEEDSIRKIVDEIKKYNEKIEELMQKI